MPELTASIAHVTNQPVAGVITKAGPSLRLLTTDLLMSAVRVGARNVQFVKHIEQPKLSSESVLHF